MKKTLTTTLFAATALVMLTGWHGGCGHSTPEEKAKRAQRMVSYYTDDFLDEIDATDDQRTKVHALTDRVVQQALPLIPEQQRAKQELIAQWKSKQPDAATVHSIIDERIDAVRKVVHVGADALIELHKLLTPEQRKEIDERLPEHR
jgi:periplasmic protein CpxP/Spy